MAVTLSLLSVQSCRETGVSVEEGMGNVEFRCTARSDVSYSPAFAKAGESQRPLPENLIPETGSLKLVLGNGDGYSAEYETLAQYDSPLLKAGEYTATFSHGDPESEGTDAAYFETVRNITVVARKTSTENISVGLANSVFSVVVSQWFADYYPEYEIAIETESGYSATFTSDDTEAGTESEPVFVKAGTALYFSGTAVKTNGAEVSFPKTEIAVTKARTWQTLGIDASEAAAGTVEIVLDDSVVKIEELEIELNPDAVISTNVIPSNVEGATKPGVERSDRLTDFSTAPAAPLEMTNKRNSNPS